MKASYKKLTISIMTALMLSTSVGFAAELSDNETTGLDLNTDRKEATSYTKAKNDAVYQLLDFQDQRELANAQRGFIGAPDELIIKDKDGNVVWSLAEYKFLVNNAPDTANPSLWRNAQLNYKYGLFEVVDGIYQVRGYDMSNITFVKGKTGWIVLDPLISTECASAAFDLVKQYIGDYPVKAVIYSHPHIDHYGGVEGIVTREEAAKQGVKIIAPDGFSEYAVSENLYAGMAMKRRAKYQYGVALDKSPQGGLSVGIGMGQSVGTTSQINPNVIITHTGQKVTVDGVEMEFQMTPGTEAPAEMNIWFPQRKALWLAENCTGTMHNLYTLRGAEIRDGNDWAEYIMEAMQLYGKDAQVVFQSHNWPHWDNDNINTYMLDTAAVYKFIHDQTLLYINQGYTEAEVSNMIQLPDQLAKNWYTRQYYGTLMHNAKAVYEKYMGWYDANPIHLAELDPTDTAKKLVEYLGDPKVVLQKAKADYDKGEYQWVAQITNTLVYADPENIEARMLCADALEQLGYQAESGAWRNSYLSAAQELRCVESVPNARNVSSNGAAFDNMTIPMLMGYLGIALDTREVEEVSCTINLILPEGNCTMVIKNGVLLYQDGCLSDKPDATWRTTKAALMGIIANNEQALASIQQEGDTTLLQKLAPHFVNLPKLPSFNLIEP